MTKKSWMSYFIDTSPWCFSYLDSLSLSVLFISFKKYLTWKQTWTDVGYRWYMLIWFFSLTVSHLSLHILEECHSITKGKGIMTPKKATFYSDHHHLTWRWCCHSYKSENYIRHKILSRQIQANLEHFSYWQIRDW